MANATAKVNTLITPPDHRKHRRAVPAPSGGVATTYYPGTLLCIDTTTGGVVKGASAANLVFDGVLTNAFAVVANPTDPNSYTLPAAYLEVERAYQFRAATLEAFTQADLFKVVYLADDQTVTKVAPANAVPCGRVAYVWGANSVTVHGFYPVS